MAKSQKKTTAYVANLNKIIERVKNKSYFIKEASVKDGLCNYTYEISEGIGIGESHSVKGAGIVKDSLPESFARLSVHLAWVDDAFKRINEDAEIKDIDKLHMDDTTTRYHVTGIKIKGGVSDESVILVGSKYVSSGGRIDLVSPKIALDNLSSYKWYNELKAEIDKCRREVELYKEGNYNIPEVDEDEANDPHQLKIGESVTDNEFDEAAI